MLAVECEYTDTFCGEANYSWVKRATISVSELTRFGYDGSRGYTKASKAQKREVIRKGKAALGLTNVRGITEEQGDMITFRPYRFNTIAVFTFK